MRKIVFFSGAGLSAESGIPTFRDSGGLWENSRIEDVATPLGWMQNPKLVLDFYAEQFVQMQQVKPNAAHYAIAKLATLLYPAANLLKFFGDVPEKYFIDPNPLCGSLDGFSLWIGKASEKMPKLVEVLSARFQQ